MSHVISHAGLTGASELSHLVEARIAELADKPELQKLAQQLAAFPLGFSLLANKGLDGFWTKYLIRTTESANSLEQKLLQAPSVRATRERFGVFQKQLQQHIRSGDTVASIPCGVMDDLLTLPKLPENVSFLGIDLDQLSLDTVRKSLSEGARVELVKQDAWQLDIEGQLNVITSNGLNIYEKDDDLVTELYRNFCKALKPGGILITSFLTPPTSGWLPGDLEKSVWKEELSWQKMIFTEVLGVNWQHFRTEETTRAQLEVAGFVDIKFIYDEQRIFPTVVARRT